jgi:hypothetical protein
MSRWTAIVLAALLGSTLSMPAAAQWKWRDRAGQTQYSDLPPPPGTAEQDILQRPNSSSAARRASPPAPGASAASGAPLLGPRASDPELEARRKKAEQELLDKQKADDAKIAAAKAENCSRAKAQVRTLESGVRLGRSNDKGEREILDDSARAAEVKRAHDVMSSQCQ